MAISPKKYFIEALNQYCFSNFGVQKSKLSSFSPSSQYYDKLNQPNIELILVLSM